jgi:AcrR family transcriptional regulator
MAAPLASMDDRSTRERVLDVAERRFAEQGFHGTSLADICGEVGIAKSSLLHHFASKRRIYAEVLERIAAELRDLHDQAMAAEGDAAASTTKRAPARYGAGC